MQRYFYNNCLIHFLMFSQVRRLVVVESAALFDTARIDLKPHRAVRVRAKGTHTHKERKACI